MAWVIDGEGHITTRHYDTLTPAADIAVPTITISGDLLSTTTTDALGHSNTSYTDGAGRALVQKDGIGNLAGAEYDANSNLVSTRDANGLGEDCVFDKLNRKTSCADLQEQAENTNRTYTHNSHSALTSTTNAQGHVDSSKYDARDRAFESTDKNNLTTGYTYDDNNNLLSLTDPRGNTRSWIYDARNLVTRKQMPQAGDKCNYRYDALRRQHISGKQNGSVVYTNFDLAGGSLLFIRR